MLELTCQHCFGQGWTGPVHINRGALGCEWVDRMDCQSCAGTGQWTAEQAVRFRDGQKARQERVERGETLREAARRLGVSAAALSAFEQGRAALDEVAPTTGPVADAS